MKKTALVCLYCAFILVLAAAAGDDRIFPGPWELPTSNIPESDFAWKDEKKPFENNNQFLLEKLDSGEWLVMNYFTFRAPLGQKWGVTAAFIDNGGKRHFFKQEIDGKDVEYRSDSAYLKMGKCFFDGKDPEYRYHFEAEGFEADLACRNMVPTWKPGDGRVYYTEDRKVYYEVYLTSPFCRISGYVVNNGKKMDAAGWGYGDRTHTDLSWFRQNRLLYAVRGFPKAGQENKYALSMLEYESHPGYGSMRMPSIVIMTDKKFLVTTKNYKLETGDFRTDPDTGYTYPWRIVMSGQDHGVTFRIVSQADRIVEILDVINEIPSYLRPILKKYAARPVFYRFSGSVTGTLVFKDGSKANLDLYGYSEVTFIQKD